MPRLNEEQARLAKVINAFRSAQGLPDLWLGTGEGDLTGRETVSPGLPSHCWVCRIRIRGVDTFLGGGH